MVDARKKLELGLTGQEVAKAHVRARCAGESPLDQHDIASACGVSASLPARWESLACPDTINLAHLIVIGRRYPSFALAMFVWAANQLDLIVSTRLRSGHLAEPLAAAAAALREVGEAVGAFVAAASQRPSPTQLVELDREVLEAEQAIARIRSWVDAEKAAQSTAPARVVRVA